MRSENKNDSDNEQSSQKVFGWDVPVSDSDLGWSVHSGPHLCKHPGMYESYLGPGYLSSRERKLRSEEHDNHDEYEEDEKPITRFYEPNKKIWYNPTEVTMRVWFEDEELKRGEDRQRG